MDDLCAINDGGEFRRSIFDIYPNELELKVEDQGHHATFLILGTTIKEKVFASFQLTECLLLKAIFPQKCFIQQSKVSF